MGENHGTHKVARVRNWLVERLFAAITERCVRRGSHTAVGMLEKAMLDYLDRRNKDPKPFVWTAGADLILGKVARPCKRISRPGHQPIGQIVAIITKPRCGNRAGVNYRRRDVENRSASYERVTAPPSSVQKKLENLARPRRPHVTEGG